MLDTRELESEFPDPVWSWGRLGSVTLFLQQVLNESEASQPSSGMLKVLLIELDINFPISFNVFLHHSMHHSFLKWKDRFVSIPGGVKHSSNGSSICSWAPAHY
jgi:hypothetical protein